MFFSFGALGEGFLICVLAMKKNGFLVIHPQFNVYFYGLPVFPRINRLQRESLCTKLMHQVASLRNLFFGIASAPTDEVQVYSVCRCLFYKFVSLHVRCM